MKKLAALKPSESLTILFLLFLIFLSSVFFKKLPGGLNLAFLYTVLLLVQILLIKKHDAPSRSKAMDFARNIIFPVLCVLIVFDSLGGIVHYINPEDADPLLIKLDYLIFNGHPTVMLESLLNPFFTDILQVAYTTHFFLAIALGLILKSSGREPEFNKSIFFILLCFYLSFIGYMLVPALGPRFTINHLQTSELKGLFVAEAIQDLLNRLEGIKRDAFPSGHTAVALVVSALACRFHKTYFYATLPVVALLIFSTVYCRYHYVVDVLAGGALAGITLFIGEKYYGYWEIRNNTNH